MVLALEPWVTVPLPPKPLWLPITTAVATPFLSKVTCTTSPAARSEAEADSPFFVTVALEISTVTVSPLSVKPPCWLLPSGISGGVPPC